uniref:Uncharacterized protein n=3 Tax=Oryza barthii TaxID=65489 RepID=A0A0D3EZV3_9ORYZ
MVQWQQVGWLESEHGERQAAAAAAALALAPSSPPPAASPYGTSYHHRPKMEGRRAAAAVALCCILILLSGDQLHQVAAMSKFCRCYSQCYPDCRKNLPRFICPNKKKVAAGDCNRFCLLAICGMALNGQADVASCVDDCTKNPNLHTKFL